MAKAVIIQPDESLEIREISTFEELKAALDGGRLQGITLSSDAYAYIDEEGKLKRLKANPVATHLCKLLKTPLFPGDRMVGPMVVFGPSESGDNTDVSESVLKLLGLA